VKREVFFFPNGNVAHCVDDVQVPELQVSSVQLYCEFLVSKGIDPEGCVLNFQCGKAHPFKTEYGWNWKFE
jgi:hypothetical protein